ncbi:hypothetical protein QR680_015325 [Steinernema hermaphroditum]|uniref:Uncharacterized protein n=1 Tax=Steinernema hermaphroditum TaxID=289476 RepID=A0AA39H977_9BILA|nr:hypothetical protein QR680_015325 [Steinernema hermaphroditum]
MLTVECHKSVETKKNMVIEFMLSVMFIWLCYTIDYERKIAGQSGIPMFGRLFDAARTFLNVPLAPPKNRKGRDRSSRRKRVSENCQKSGKEERLPSPASDKKHGSKHRRVKLMRCPADRCALSSMVISKCPQLSHSNRQVPEVISENCRQSYRCAMWPWTPGTPRNQR